MKRRKKKVAPMSKQPLMKPPAGFQELTGGFAPVWEPESKGETIEGTVMDTRIIKAKKKGQKDSAIMTLSHEGLAQDVWLSAQLQQKIGDPKKAKGRHFMIIFLGTRKLKAGQNPMKEFQVFEKKGKK